ncbi:hypothetical protein C1C98_10620 [Pseudomonas ogarae]|uniref:Uncharacterized protein n=1 Tax=Pseudomonas ogarae (strain DSM 112162 / CECT 30235 / F113) TaxID=1114970 RepID=A0ABM6QX95_PSEO1|nr:hypothetical protein C1C98_10620 [Pseudomonas ogarae]
MLAMNDDTVLQLDHVACIAGKPCSHRYAPTGCCVWISAPPMQAQPSPQTAASPATPVRSTPRTPNPAA